MVMNKFYMSLDEVGKNEFYIACLYLVKDIIRDVEKREGLNRVFTNSCYSMLCKQ